MKIGTYLEQVGMKQSQFAALVGADEGTVSRWVNGHSRPGWGAIANIERATGGKVTASDFMPAAGLSRPDITQPVP